ncbi:GDSL esterase/lipase [Quillaja saponaria]|uniref:GDSL esterase/lipase n=1 Tax=Quillaja saponaria TaxID=32244 RepID=A0AAD7LDG4_QUISA|nr:GDSL esterase/lipase [Quillaja saponaria]
MKMQKIFKPLILVCLFSLILLSSESQVPVNKLVPALYIFGDSNVDAGNNNVLKTTIRGNVKPYGIDFPGGLSADTGRMTNGFTFVDFFSDSKLVPALYIFGDSNVDSGNNNNLKTMFKGNVKPYGIDFPGGLSTGSGRMTKGFAYVDFLLESKGSNRLAPALYVFGDATVDAGNNEKLNTEAKANFPPYGIDLPGGAKASGRFTNGRTIVDFYAEWLGLKSPPPFLKVNLTGAKILSGFNYASGSSGILEETGKKFGENLSLGKQVMLFKQTVEGYLTTLLKNRGGIGRLRKHLSKSIFLIVSGSSDFNLNLLPPYENKSWSDTPDEFTPFTSLLANTIEQHLKVG